MEVGLLSLCVQLLILTFRPNNYQASFVKYSLFSLSKFSPSLHCLITTIKKSH